MIQTEVKSTGSDEHDIHVHVPGKEYERIYAEQVNKIMSKARLPGFRPGKTPKNVIMQKFSGRLIEDTASALVQEHYIKALEESGLIPAVQPEIDIAGVADTKGFDFTIRVVTWPRVELKKLSRLSVTQTVVEAKESDVQSVIDRLMQSQVKYETAGKVRAEQGDEVHLDYTGYLDDEPFEGGRAENAGVVIGSEQLLPDLEQGLIGVVAGDERTINVNFPEGYQHAPLAGKKARFEVKVRKVGKAVHPKNEDELAGMLNFADAAALRMDMQARLGREAGQASFEVTRQAVFDALLAANTVSIPEAMVRQDMAEARKRITRDMQSRGMEATPEMFEEEKLRERLHNASEENLKIAVLLQAVRQEASIDIDEPEVEAEIDQLAREYPEARHDQFRQWIRGQKEQLDSIKNRLVEKKIVEFIVSQAKVKKVSKSLDEWQAEKDAEDRQGEHA